MRKLHLDIEKVLFEVSVFAISFWLEPYTKGKIWFSSWQSLTSWQFSMVSQVWVLKTITLKNCRWDDPVENAMQNFLVDPT